MAHIRALSLEEVTTGDTYQFAYAHSWPGSHWSPDSLYLEDEAWGIGVLAPALSQVFPQFAWYGPQKVPLSQWRQAEALCLAGHPGDPAPEQFFLSVRRWLAAGNRGAEYFWILGV